MLIYVSSAFSVVGNSMFLNAVTLSSVVNMPRASTRWPSSFTEVYPINDFLAKRNSRSFEKS